MVRPLKGSLLFFIVLIWRLFMRIISHFFLQPSGLNLPHGANKVAKNAATLALCALLGSAALAQQPPVQPASKAPAPSTKATAGTVLSRP